MTQRVRNDGAEEKATHLRRRAGVGVPSLLPEPSFQEVLQSLPVKSPFSRSLTLRKLRSFLYEKGGDQGRSEAPAGGRSSPPFSCKSERALRCEFAPV